MAFFAVKTPEAELEGVFRIFLIVTGSVIWKRRLDRERIDMEKL